MPTKFKEKQTRSDIQNVLIDHDLDLSSDEVADLINDLVPLTEDIFWAGHEHGKVVERLRMKSIEDIAEDDEFELLEEIPDDFYFPSEPE